MNKPTYKALTKGRVSIPNQIYHIRMCTWNRKPYFEDFILARTLIRALMNQSHRCTTLCFVVMPDHIHWLLQLCCETSDLSQIIRGVKLSTTFEFRKQFTDKLWQAGFYDRAIRYEDDIPAVARYIVRNPLRAGLVKSVKDYSHWDAVFF